MTDVLVASERRTPPSLLGYLPRLCRWTVLAGGTAITWALTWWRAGDITNESSAVWMLRVAIVLGCVTAAFALDDPSRNVTEPAVGTRRWLVPARLLVVLVVVMAAALPAAVAVGDEISARVTGGLVIEAVAVTALVCAVALTLQRRWRIPEPAQFVVLCVPLLAAADPLSGGRWPLLVGPGPDWDSAHIRWVMIAVMATGLCAWQLRDPAARVRLPLGIGRHRASGTTTSRR